LCDGGVHLSFHSYLTTLLYATSFTIFIRRNNAEWGIKELDTFHDYIRIILYFIRELAFNNSSVSFFIVELQEKLCSEDFQTLQSKIRLIADEANPFLAFDEEGNRFAYSREAFHPKKDVPIKAIDWLEIHEPDYYD